MTKEGCHCELHCLDIFASVLEPDSIKAKHSRTSHEKKTAVRAPMSLGRWEGLYSLTIHDWQGALARGLQATLTAQLLLVDYELEEFFEDRP